MEAVYTYVRTYSDEWNPYIHVYTHICVHAPVNGSRRAGIDILRSVCPCKFSMQTHTHRYIQRAYIHTYIRTHTCKLADALLSGPQQRDDVRQTALLHHAHLVVRINGQIPAMQTWSKYMVEIPSYGQNTLIWSKFPHMVDI